MSSYVNEMLVKARIDDLLREADKERLAREAQAGKSTQRRRRDGWIMTIVRRAGGLSARIMRAHDAHERDRRGAAL
ncbi:MAG TPA: hypothetical protein VES19_01425 [Candidatus Limnocylindrales bacterium]|nr:hypothetical protein [Candidatus Limnocylindrales bacterium]